jgi:sodium transport system permease protein
MAQASNPLIAVFVFALVPAICEEVACRGLILSGLESRHRTGSAILLSALMFGFLHVLLSLFQQLFNATLLGIVLGLLAVRSRSILPGIVFHFLNNAYAVLLSVIVTRHFAGPILDWIYRNPAEGLYHGAWIACSAVVSPLLLYYLWTKKVPTAEAVAPAGVGTLEPTS